MPDAASINYGENDVRHFSEGDAMDVPGLSRPTRNLAQRDVALANKVNELVADVNNKEQFVPLPVLRTTLPPDSEEIIQNFRIPPGFEARVLNAVVTSIPASSSAELDIYYSANTYGSSTGVQVVTTSVEYTGGTTFYSSGEFVITLKNRGGATLELIASILLTMRPIGSLSSSLLSSATPSLPGPPGPTGSQGIPGNTGPIGPAGSPGLVWYSGGWQVGFSYPQTAVTFYNGSAFKSKVNGNMGNIPVGGVGDSNWEFLAEKGDPGFNWRNSYTGTPSPVYTYNDAVEYLGSSYVCIVASSSGHNPVAYLNIDWHLVAAAGENGFRYRGTWSYPPGDAIASQYIQNDVVSVVVLGVSQTYVAVAAVPNPLTSPPNSDWNQLFSSNANTFQINSVSGTLYPESDYLPMASDGVYVGLPVVFGGSLKTNFQELSVSDATSGHGMAILKYSYLARWLGSVTLILPQEADGASVNWLASNAVFSVLNSGTVTSYGTATTAQATLPQGFLLNGTFSDTRLTPYLNKVTISNPANQACSVSIGIMGMQVF